MSRVHFKTTLREALLASGTAITNAIRRPKRVTHKGAVDILTETDVAIERLITRMIQKRFPDHAIMGEESNTAYVPGMRPVRQADYTWIIDPIDGTTNFAHTYPHVSTSIALEHRGRIVLGGVYDPLRKELFLAERGTGAFLNGKRMKVSPTPRLAGALLATGFPYDRRAYADFYVSFMKSFLMKCMGIRRGGSAALDLAWVAAGRLDGYWEFKLKPWDAAAGALLVEEAGGRLTNCIGGHYNLYGTETLATNGCIHAEAVRILTTGLGAYARKRGVKQYRAVR